MQDNEDSLPCFDNIQTALLSNAPFKLSWSAQTKVLKDLTQIPEDKIVLVHNALLYGYNELRWEIKKDQDLTRLVELLTLHKREIGTVTLNIYALINFDNHGLTVFQSSAVKSICLKAFEAPIEPVLRAIQHHQHVDTLIIDNIIPSFSEYEGLACAISNEHLRLLQFNEFVLDVQAEIDLCTALAPALVNHKTLHTLSIKSVGPIGHILGQVLSTNKSIQCVGLGRDHDTTDDNWIALCSGLTNNSTLKKLRLSNMTKNAVSKLLDLVALNRCPVPELVLNYRDEVDDALMNVLGRILKFNTTLIDLTFFSYNFSAADFQLWHDGLIQNTTLKSLKFEHVKFNRDNVVVLCEALVHNIALQVLDIQLSDESSFEAVASMITKNKSLTDLTVMSYDHENEGLACIADAVATNVTLRRFKFQCSVPGTKGMTGVKSMLTRNTTLRRFDFFVWDYYDDENIDLLWEGLKHNTGLTTLGFSDLIPSENFEQHFAAALEHNFSLDTIDDSQFPMQYEPINQLIQRNRSRKSQVKFKIAILSHNIARSREALTTLPREIWIGVLSMVTHPGLESFESFVRTTFDSYMHE